ncbi:fibronectin type III domain-containing protein [Desulfurobacterium atlanticum]|uniref:Fibronectin type-III domain-containing protein n=1 Tax=Desulfurobacterium atlanticum TaxID=240169 RepID=A0A238ZTT1_9BACT|nr:hypothetical protein [Desulfurobacterium atlanticum]SNR86745.1 hypothetical protein SAMN06265340_1127 [Desulfurobacterium atlanticum]
MKNYLLFIFILISVSSFGTCGRKGDPLPPRIFEPATVNKLNYQQVILKPLIYWNPPSKFIDGEPIPKNSIKNLKYLIDINFGEKKAVTDKLYFLDGERKMGEKVCYRVAAIYKKEKGEFSEPVCFKIEKPIKEKPSVGETFAGDETVKILFRTPTLHPIEIFRTEKKKPFSVIKPYAIINNATFVDKKVINGKTYIYKFRYAENRLKGPFTEPVQLTPEDNIPPEPPKNPVLVRLDNSTCIIVWEPSPSKDTVYYTIFLNDKELGKTENLYFQTTCKKGIFKVIAVDKAGNLSIPEAVKRR